jgi:hypothetical protein
MLDLLAAIVAADPPALLAWLILAFAASGYPLGIMLGSSCSPCCGTPCSQCAEGELPDTLTVTFSGLQDQTPGPDLCLLTFSAPYGGGAAGKVTAPGGDPDTDKGPISSVSLTSGGSGYAKLGRVAPTITASGGSGTGATFSVSTTSANDANGIPSWRVTGVTVTGTPTGYADGDQITFSVAEGDTEEQAAAATINTTRAAPTLSVSAPTGSGATFSISYTANGGSPATWSVSGITVTAGGTGYTDGSALTLSLGSGDKVDSEAYATILTNRLQPTLTASVTSDAGTGAALSVSLTQTTDYDGRAVWNVSGITATSGGSDYVVGDPVAVAVTDGQETYYSYFSASVSSVDGGGAITGITIDYGGEYFKDGGVIQSVAVDGGGAYYKDNGVITGVTVDAGGTYYREDASVAPYVAIVTVGVEQTPPSDGTGATLTATVESSTSSANFGKVTGVTIGSGGSNYLAWEWKNTLCCGWYWNGKPVVLKRLNYGSGDACYYQHRMCGGWNNRGAKGLVALQYNGPSGPPTLSLLTELSPETNNATQCNTSFAASGNVTNCSEWSGVSFSASGGATATVSSGGEYDSEYKAGWCHPCCQGEEPLDTEITVSVTSAENGYHNVYGPSGDYVLIYNALTRGWFWSGGTPSLTFNISLSIGPCADHCDECIKKCTTTASCGIQSHPAVWFDPAEYDMRSCFQWDLEFGSDEYNATECSNFCEHSNPTCKPSGTFNFYKANWSDNFSAAGCPGCCDENTEPSYNPETEEFDGPPLEHRNVFVLEVIG